MRLGRFFGMAAIAATVAACSADARDDQQGASEGALTSDVRATHCEVFVDRVMPLTGSHALRQISFWVKTLNERLDAPIDHVALYRRRTESPCPGGGGSCSDTWHEERLEPFAGSADYFQLTLFIGGDYAPSTRYEGAFFVQTTKGTKYWANPQGGGNFFVDEAMYEHLRGNVYTSPPHYAADPREADVPADEFPYLNPDRCR